MADPAEPTPSDRASIRAIAAAVIEAVRADKSIPLAMGIGRDWARNYPGGMLVYHADDAESVFVRMAQELAELERELAAVRAARDKACTFAEEMTAAMADLDNTDPDEIEEYAAVIDGFRQAGTPHPRSQQGGG